MLLKRNIEVGKIRFWSSGLRRKQQREHSLNPSSYGSRDPRVNYSFVSMNTGSFERIRIDCQMDQPVSGANDLGKIVLTNFSNEVGNVIGKSFEKDKTAIGSEIYYISRFSPKFDLSQEDNKVRIRKI